MAAPRTRRRAPETVEAGCRESEGVMTMKSDLPIALCCACSWLAMPAAAQTPDDANGQEEQIVVTGAYTLDDRIDTATGLGLTVRETPQSVSIMTAQRILDQNLISVKDV